jgi:23S rRNA pseudouridine1911/1915/1917 synthase
LPVRPGLFSFRIAAENAGKRLDLYLSTKFRRSRTSLRQRLEGCVFGDDGRALRWGHRLRDGEVVRVQSEVRPEPVVSVSYHILYADPWLVVIDKGPGAPVHPVRGFRTRTILTRLREELADPTLQLGHRLDRETSGVLVFGRGVEILNSLMKQFAGHQVEKRYIAVVRGVPAFNRCRVEAPLALDRGFPIVCRMKVDPANGQKAITEFEVLARYTDRALVAAYPHTGRQHQIRLHLAHLGYPVLGDKLYQEDGRPYLAMIKDQLTTADFTRLGHKRQALHAERLTLTHPHTGEALTFVAPLPEDLRDLLLNKTANAGPKPGSVSCQGYPGQDSAHSSRTAVAGNLKRSTQTK